MPTVQHLHVSARVSMVTALLQLLQRKSRREASFVHNHSLGGVAVQSHIIISTARRDRLERCKKKEWINQFATFASAVSGTKEDSAGLCDFCRLCMGSALTWKKQVDISIGKTVCF